MTPHEAWVRAQVTRIHRTTKGLLAATKRHVPKWMAALITIALLGRRYRCACGSTVEAFELNPISQLVRRSTP